MSHRRRILNTPKSIKTSIACYVRYQRAGEVELAVDVNGDSEDNFEVAFGPNRERDSDEEPLVMACCPPAGDGPPCLAPHVQACFIAAVEQGCKSMSVRLASAADNAIGVRTEALDRGFE